MARLHITTDSSLELCVSEVDGDDYPYTEVSDDLWRRYQQAQAAFQAVEAELEAWSRSHPPVRPSWDVEDLA